MQEVGKERKCRLAKFSATVDGQRLENESLKFPRKPHVQWKRGVFQKVGDADAGSSSSSGLQICNRLSKKTASDEFTFKSRVQNVNFGAEVPKSYWELAGIDTSKFDYTAYDKTKTGVHECNFMSLRGAPEGLDIHVVKKPMRDKGMLRLLKNLSKALFHK